MGNKFTFVLLFFVFGIFFHSLEAAAINATCNSKNSSCTFSGGLTCSLGGGGQMLCMHATERLKKCTYDKKGSLCKAANKAAGMAGQTEDESEKDNLYCDSQYGIGCKNKSDCEKSGHYWDSKYEFCNAKQDCLESYGQSCEDNNRAYSCGAGASEHTFKLSYQSSTRGTIPVSTKSCGCLGEDGTTWTQVGENAECPKKASNEPAACGPNTESPPRKHEKGADAPVTHYDCVCKFANADGIKGQYVGGNREAEATASCPASETKKQPAVTKEASAEDGLSCIQDIRTQINKCKNVSTNAVKTCDMQSESNENTRNQLSSLTNVSGQLIHASTAEQCRNMGLATAAAGYGISQIQSNCNEEMKQCKDACADVEKYAEADKIKAHCIEKSSQDFAKQNAEALESQADDLASTVEASKEECTKPDSTAETLANSAAKALQSATSAYKTAAQCEAAVTAAPTLNANISIAGCAANPGAAGCPVDCSKPPGSSSSQCKCFSDPASCKGGPAAQMAGNPNSNQYRPTGVGSGSVKFGGSGGSGSGGGGLDMDMGDASEKPPTEQAKQEGQGNMFGAAGGANAGGIGGTSAGEGAKGKHDKGDGSGEDHGMFGGMLQTLKSAAGSLFGNGNGGSGSKKAATAANGANAAGLKPITNNKGLRGLASNGNSCFLDAVGTKYCFPRANRDIFKVMSEQYQNQGPTLISDK